MQYSDERGKVFVGGLSWDTTHASLLKYFARYGEVIDCVVMKNQQTLKSRGFGFVTFKNPSCVDLVLSAGPHILDGRQIDPKACNPRSMNKGGKSAENGKRKVFIGGLPANCTESLLKDVFSQYGNVTDVVIMYDQQKHRSRGFGFLTYETEDEVERVCNDHFVQISGKQVECKKAEPRDFKMAADMPSSSVLLLSQQGQPGGVQLAVTASSVTPAAMTLTAANSYHHATATALAHAGWTAHHAMPMAGYGLAAAGNLNYAGWTPALLQPTATPEIAPGIYNGLAGSYGAAYAPAMHAMPTAAALEAYAMHGHQHQGRYAACNLAAAGGMSHAMGMGDSIPLNKNIYTAGMSRITHQFEILGNYPREASGFGPARGCPVDGTNSGVTNTVGLHAQHLHNSSAQISFTPTVTYSLAPGMTALPVTGGSSSGGQAGFTLPPGPPMPAPVNFVAAGGQGDAPQQQAAAIYLPQQAIFGRLAAAATHATAMQNFHPYRR